jgi:stage II sporulation protein D
MPAGFDIEALKAQAVASRTYALTRMKAFGGKGCDRHAGADVCTDSGHCQEWMSREDRLSSWSAAAAQGYWEKLSKAVNDTKGLMLTYDSAPVMYPLYFSTSSGKTENSEDYFSNPEPYLKSVVSPNEDEAPKFVTTVSFSLDDFVKRIYDSKHKIKLDKAKLQTQFRVLSNTEGGGVKEIQVGSKKLTGRDIREVFGLNSANFSFKIGKTSITFTVTGNGHGVGMSQWGANEMGKRGSKYDEILKHYYKGVGIVNYKDVYLSK